MITTLFTKRTTFLLATLTLINLMPAATITWEGNASGSLTTAANWVGGVAPVSGTDALQFGAAGTREKADLIAMKETPYCSGNLCPGVRKETLIKDLIVENWSRHQASPLTPPSEGRVILAPNSDACNASLRKC